MIANTQSSPKGGPHTEGEQGRARIHGYAYSKAPDSKRAAIPQTDPLHRDFNTWVRSAPLFLALVLLLFGGVFLLERAERQARDTIRKHHIQDIEKSLYSARGVNGTYPPYNGATWCGLLDDPRNSGVRQEIETILRRQNEKYANPEKPFPSDPLFAGTSQGYFYWKRSPSLFELYTILENEKTGDRNTSGCTNAPQALYDYGIASRWRENNMHTTILDMPL